MSVPAGAFNLAPCVLTGLRPHRPCRSLWHGRVDRLLTALHGLSTEALLLHCQLVARSATRSLVEAGIVRVLVSSIASSAVPTETLVTAFATVTALIDAAKAAEPDSSMLEATVAAELLEKGLLSALKVAIREEWAPERFGGRHRSRRPASNPPSCAGPLSRRPHRLSLSPAVAVRSGAAAIGEIFRLQCRLLHCALSPCMRETVPPEFMHAPLIHVAFIVSGAPAGENIGLLASPGHWPRGGRGGCAGPGRSYAPQSAA